MADFGWGSIGINSQGETHCEVYTKCGFNGNYAMFEPIESADTKPVYDLGLVSENDRRYFQPKIPEDSVVLSKEEWASLQGKAWASTFKEAEILQLKEELKQARQETAGALLSELYYIVRFYYGNSANVLAWAREKATKLGVEIKE